MKSCCTACKQGKPCAPDMGPRALNGLFRKSIGYGVYSFGDNAIVEEDDVEVVSVMNPTTGKIFGVDKKTIFYVVAGVLAYKLLV